MNLNANAENFNSVVLKAKTPVLLYISKENCDPCKRMGTQIGRLETSSFPLYGDTKIVKLDFNQVGDPDVRRSDLHNFFKRTLTVKHLPAFALVSDGEVKGYREGVTKADDIEQWVECRLLNQ